MSISTLAGALWAAGFIANAALLLVLLARRRYAAFPFFTAYIAFNVLRTITLFLIFRASGAVRLYARVYWSATALEFLLQLLVLAEVLRKVIPPDVWGEDARRRFRRLAAAGIIVSIALTTVIRPHLPHSIADWMERGQIFTATLMIVLLLAMALSTTALGLGWSRHTAALATGLAIWGLTAFFVEGAYAVLGAQWRGLYLDYFRIFAYLAVVLFWVATFALPEREKRPLTAEQKEYLGEIQLHAEQQAQFLNRRKR